MILASSSASIESACRCASAPASRDLEPLADAERVSMAAQRPSDGTSSTYGSGEFRCLTSSGQRRARLASWCRRCRASELPSRKMPLLAHHCTPPTPWRPAEALIVQRRARTTAACDEPTLHGATNRDRPSLVLALCVRVFACCFRVPSPAARLVRVAPAKTTTLCTTPARAVHNCLRALSESKPPHRTRVVIALESARWRLMCDGDGWKLRRP
ncbi:hypothetical protein FA09DRAFT_43108 [Tilletiopsis washingtonensis]|uniref:Uncharacterized protein n=1 Tax=Tilletiopsis washingtonensis TaxID=58919 RepID=A0A316Z9P5_9BASI|nr:hypothetical protein FA09DRAFT_43108 [Tilletiopsis washingtonensis]PWN97672.1 hypothetical protein FA09DRAFT_43108 [Tilletiopsis washingtonensis]